MATTEDDILMELSIKEMLMWFKGILIFNHEERKTKEGIVHCILCDGPVPEIEFLHQVGQSKRQAKCQLKEINAQAKKWKQAEKAFLRCTARCEDFNEDVKMQDTMVGPQQQPAHDKFLTIPDDDTVRDCYRAF